MREFSPRPIPSEVIAECVAAAGTAPSGANRQPWRFVVVQDSETKARIRRAAEKEERVFYRTAPKEWLDALAALGTDDSKPFLEVAPCLIAIFAERYLPLEGGGRASNYYVQESVGIATGILITALHAAGLATLTHTPSPMRFLKRILKRPEHERPFLLLVVGYPASSARVPDIARKPLDEIVSFWKGLPARHGD